MLIQTRLTLKYKVPKQKEEKPNPTTATLVAKAYDPVGGVCIKYETNRAVEVGRLMVGFQDLGQLMQNRPPAVEQKENVEEDEVKGDVITIDEPKSIAQEKIEGMPKPEIATHSVSSQTAGGKKKKKWKR